MQGFRGNWNSRKILFSDCLCRTDNDKNARWKIVSCSNFGMEEGEKYMTFEIEVEERIVRRNSYAIGEYIENFGGKANGA